MKQSLHSFAILRLPSKRSRHSWFGHLCSFFLPLEQFPRCCPILLSSWHSVSSSFASPPAQGGRPAILATSILCLLSSLELCQLIDSVLFPHRPSFWSPALCSSNNTSWLTHHSFPAKTTGYFSTISHPSTC